MRFVHRDGRIGDFARAGILFLFDIAFLSRDDDPGDTLSSTPGPDGSDPLQDARDALAEYILDGDFADVMAAGLGATYSLLPSKLRVPTLAEQGDDDAALNGGMVLGTKVERGGEDEDDEDDDDMLLSTDEDVHFQLDLLLKLFGFLQDILHRCRAASLRADPLARTLSSTEVLGPAVADATLDALQTAFVDNVLYPSILECSPTDGSSVAVLTYLDVMLSGLEDGPVLQRILNVLMDANAAVPVFTSPRKKNRKTGAMSFMPAVAKIGYYTDERFTLRDLILDNVQSSSHASVTAALHLLQTLLGEHCRHIAPSLLTLVRMPYATALARPSLPPSGTSTPSPDWSAASAHTLTSPVNSTDVHLQEDELYGALVPRLDDAVQENMDTASGLGTYLTDAHNLLESDGCWRSSRVPLQFVSDDGKPALLRVGEYELDPFQHALNPSDPVVQALLDALSRWFTMPADANVALTGALSALVRCPHRSLAGWLLYDMASDHDPWSIPVEKEIDDSASDTSFDAAPSRAPSRADDLDVTGPPLPALYQVLRELVRHVGRFRASIPGFDRLLSERRQGLLFADHLEEAMSAMLENTDVVPAPAAPSPGFLGAALGMASPFGSGGGGERKKSVGGGIASSLRSFWSPRKSRPTTPAPSTPGSPSPSAAPLPRPTTPTPGPGAGAGVAARSFPTSPTPAPALLRNHSSPAPAQAPPSPSPAPMTLPARHSSMPHPAPASLRPPPPTASTSTPTPTSAQEPPLPFSGHYAAASVAVDVEPVHPVLHGQWRRATPVLGAGHDVFRDADDADADDQHVEKEREGGEGREEGTTTTLSSVLDNMIVLEELIKELVAVIVARRALGIDQVGFVARGRGQGVL